MKHNQEAIHKINMKERKFEVIEGGKSSDPIDPNWLGQMAVGQWFISRPNLDNTPQLWMLKFKFSTVYLLYTNMNVEFRQLVIPEDFSKKNVLIEKLDIEEQ